MVSRGASLARLSPAETAALRDFADGVRVMLGATLRQVCLFGSRARGEGDEDSDLDVAVIVAPGGRSRRREVQDLAFTLHLSTGIDIAPLVIEQPALDDLRARELALAHALDHDGVPL
jgi:predicted nucleotidyltransferase